MEYRYKIGFIGAGNMAQAIIEGIVKSGIARKEEIIISRKSITKREIVNGMQYTPDNNEVIGNAEYVFLAVKPQVFSIAAGNLKGAACRCVISVMAGIKIEKIARYFPTSQVIRAMPNTPCKIGRGMTVLTECANREITEYVERIFSAVGTAILIKEELFDAVVSVSGSGSAYVYYFIRALIEGGVEGGLDYATAKILAAETFSGAAAMVKISDESIDTLIKRVCSPNGTTECAIKRFDNSKLHTIIKEGIKDCRERSAELAEEL